MKMISCTMGILATLAVTTSAVTGASAQSVNLSGRYKCIQVCRWGLVGGPAYVTQNGPDLNLLNEAGEASRAWADWFAPETRIWIDRWDEGAVYSPDGMTIQFDNGSVWQRDLGLPPARSRR